MFSEYDLLFYRLLCAIVGSLVRIESVKYTVGNTVLTMCTRLRFSNGTRYCQPLRTCTVTTRRGGRVVGLRGMLYSIIIAACKDGQGKKPRIN